MLSRGAHARRLSSLSSSIVSTLDSTSSSCSSSPSFYSSSCTLSHSWKTETLLGKRRSTQHMSTLTTLRNPSSNIIPLPSLGPSFKSPTCTTLTAELPELHRPIQILQHDFSAKGTPPSYRSFSFLTLSSIRVRIGDLRSEWSRWGHHHHHHHRHHLSWPVCRGLHCHHQRRTITSLGGTKNEGGSSSSSRFSLESSLAKEPLENEMDKVGVAPLPPEEEEEDSLPEDAAARVDGMVDSSKSLTVDAASGIGESQTDEGSTQMLMWEEDNYDGIIINPAGLPSDGDVFLSRLRVSLAAWTREKRKGIWLKIPSAKVNLVPLAIAEKFDYYYAESNYVVLTKWLPSSPSTLPPNASHQVGVGAFVVNEKREVLAVQEKNGVLRGKNVWKLPTGLVDQQEDISVAAVREVKEETGIEAEFVEIVAFQQAHGRAFGKSDLFFVCALKPLTFNVTVQESEIEGVQWMPLDEFMEQPFFKTRKVFMTMLGLCVAHLDGRHKGFKRHPMPLGVASKSPSPAEVYSCDWIDAHPS